MNQNTKNTFSALNNLIIPENSFKHLKIAGIINTYFCSCSTKNHLSAPNLPFYFFYAEAQSCELSVNSKDLFALFLLGFTTLHFVKRAFGYLGKD